MVALSATTNNEKGECSVNRRTKIVATIGPASWEEPMLRQLIHEGVDVVRFNFSHADLDQTTKTMALVRRLAEEEGRNVAILQDLQGPRIRVGTIDGTIQLEPNHSFTLTCHPTPGSAEKASVDYAGLAHDVHPGDTICWTMACCNCALMPQPTPKCVVPLSLAGH